MSTTAPPLPQGDIYDVVQGITFHLAPDGALTLCLPEPNYESTLIELTPDTLGALFAFADRVDLQRLLARLGIAPPVHD